MTPSVCRVSVILPTHNGARFLKRAVQSVEGQTLKEWELLIVDDGSTDETSEVASALARANERIRLLRNDKNLGIQKSLNRGLREAKGDYIARVDDDDWWSDRNKLQEQVKFLDEHTNHILVGTGVVVVNDAGEEIFRFLPPPTDEEIRRKMLYRSCFTHSSVMFRRREVLELGGYDESPATLHVEDYDLWLRLGRRGKLANLPVYATAFTLRRGAISAENKIEQFEKDIRLARRHNNDYPRYWLALPLGYARLLAYRAFRLLPSAWRNLILRTYKSI